MIADNHIGDWGTQFGKLIIGYNNYLDRRLWKVLLKNLKEFMEFSKAAEENPGIWRTVLEQN